MDDADLVRKVLRGEREAFGALVEKYKALAVMYAFRRVKRISDAEDVAQDAFVRAFVSLKGLKDPEKFRSWFLAILANRARDWYRKKREKLGIELEDQPESSSISRENELRLAVVEAIESLPEKYQLVAAMRYLEGLRYSEISAKLGLSEVALRKRIHRANSILREKLRGFD